MTNYKTSTDKHVMEFNRLELNISMKKKSKKDNFTYIMTLKNRFISQSPFQEIYMVFQRSFHFEQVGIIMMNLQSIPGNSDNCSKSASI